MEKRKKNMNMLKPPHPLYLVCFVPQLQLTQRIPVPQEPVSIIVPIVYDMATGLTQQADIPRQHSSSGAAALLVSNILKRFNELHPARQGETLPSLSWQALNNLLYLNLFQLNILIRCKTALLTLTVFFSSQASAPYLHLFTTWWPASPFPLAPVSRNDDVKPRAEIQPKSL